jgi:SAM-dependent methyltransferase
MPLQDVFLRVGDALTWRVAPLRGWVERLLGQPHEVWQRVVMNRATRQLVSSCDVAALDALEIGGVNWKEFGFRSYRSIDYPEYDLCAAPQVTEGFDLIILEQVLEHIAWPYRAVRHLRQMLKPGGHVLVTTPFLVKRHDFPIDCSRWTLVALPPE